VGSDWPWASRTLRAQRCALHKFWWSLRCIQKSFMGPHGVAPAASSR
jgi:hypothetical protein